MNITKYAVYQYSYAIFGVGTTIDEAIEDAKQFTDNLSDNVPIYDGQNVDGEMYIIVVTDRLYYKAQEVGGSDVPIEHSGYPYVWDVSEKNN